VTEVSYVEVYEALLKRSLERGVPSAAVADIFELPLETVKEMAREVRVERFNTHDQAEYVEFLQMEALERTQQIIRKGSPDQVARIATTVFGRQIAAAGKRPTTTAEDNRTELMEAFTQVRDGAPRATAPGRFVMGNTGGDRRANQVEDEDDE
jgi:hypothetical protein